MKRLVAAVGLVLLAACSKDLQTKPPMDAEAPAPDETPRATVWPDESFRYQSPEPGAVPQVEAPTPHVFELDSGVTVYLVARDNIPTVSLSLVFPTGSVIDPVGKRGVAGTCMDLIEQGTEALDKPAFEARKADLASGVGAFANAETSGVSMSCLHRTFADTADLMLDMLERPGLRQRDLDRVRSRRQANLTQNKAAPGSLGRRLWRSVVWGPEHPYGRLTSTAQYDTMTVDDCRGWLKRLGPQGASMFVAGATTEAEIRKLFDERLAAWGSDARGKVRASVTLEAPAATPREGTLFFVDVPGAAQSQIYVGHPGPKRQDAGYEATTIMSHILGGSFSSRINMNIREDKGYAYGARARFSYRRTGGTFAATSSVRSDATAASIREMVKEIRALRASGVTEEEMEREREGMLLRLPAQFSTARRVRNTVSNLVYFGLPLDYYEGYQKRIEALQPSDLQRAAATHLRDGGWVVLVVGDGAVVREPLRALVDDGTLGGKAFIELDGDGNVVQTSA